MMDITRLFKTIVTHQDNTFSKITINSEQDEPEEWEVNVLVSPLEVGKAWPFTRFDLYLGTKMVEAFEEVNVPAGIFKHIVLQGILNHII